jgi:hypothetical protein
MKGSMYPLIRTNVVFSSLDKGIPSNCNLHLRATNVGCMLACVAHLGCDEDAALCGDATYWCVSLHEDS